MFSEDTNQKEAAIALVRTTLPKNRSVSLSFPDKVGGQGGRTHIRPKITAEAMNQRVGDSTVYV